LPIARRSVRRCVLAGAGAGRADPRRRLSPERPARRAPSAADRLA